MATGGSSFFPEQQRLLEVVLATRTLAAEAGADVSDYLPQDRIDSSLRRRRALMVVGAVNAGKSSLVNALCRASLCRVSKLPDTKRITVYQMDGTESARFSHPLAEICQREHVAVLQDFTVIDTPGANDFTLDMLAAVCAMACECDFILVVLAVTNPWDPATWDTIARLPEPLHHRLVFILQHADLRSLEDIQVLVGHVADLAYKRCGVTPRVFPVAAPAPVAGNRVPQASGCVELWNYLTGQIRNDASYRETITHWKTRASDALRKLDDDIDQTRREIGFNLRLLDEVEEGVGLMHASFRRQLESRLDELAATFRAGNSDSLRLLRKRMWFLPSLFRLFGRDRTAAAMEETFVARLKSTFEHIEQEDAMAIIASCRDHAQSIEERFRQQAMSPPMTGEILEKTLAQAGKHFRDTLDKAAGIRLENVRVRNRLAKELRRRNRALAAFVASCLIFLTLGSVAGALGTKWPAIALCSIALLFLVGGFCAAWRTKPRVLEVFDQQMDDACLSFAKGLLTDYEEALRVVFGEYTNIMTPLRLSLTQRETAGKPLQKRWQALYLRLKALE